MFIYIVHTISGKPLAAFSKYDDAVSYQRFHTIYTVVSGVLLDPVDQVAKTASETIIKNDFITKSF
jgi:hypothetical protein